MAEARGVGVEDVASLASRLPQQSRVRVAEDRDAAWGMREVLLALIHNDIADLTWAMGGAKGRRPPHIGPDWLAKAGQRKAPTRHMSREALDAQIARFARLAKEEDDGEH